MPKITVNRVVMIGNISNSEENVPDWQNVPTSIVQFLRMQVINFLASFLIFNSFSLSVKKQLFSFMAQILSLDVDDVITLCKDFELLRKNPPLRSNERFKSENQRMDLHMEPDRIDGFHFKNGFASLFTFVLYFFEWILAF